MINLWSSGNYHLKYFLTKSVFPFVSCPQNRKTRKLLQDKVMHAFQLGSTHKALISYFIYVSCMGGDICLGPEMNKNFFVTNSLINTRIPNLCSYFKFDHGKWVKKTPPNRQTNRQIFVNFVHTDWTHLLHWYVVKVYFSTILYSNYQARCINHTICIFTIHSHRAFWLWNGIGKTCPWKKYILLY